RVGYEFQSFELLITGEASYVPTSSVVRNCLSYASRSKFEERFTLNMGRWGYDRHQRSCHQLYVTFLDRWTYKDPNPGAPPCAE
ncbi:hypothetical protein QR685DRAFT_437950, partial [Neurospora intermedia]